MFEIAVCTTLHGSNESQTLCLNNLDFLKTLYPNIVPILLQFKEDTVSCPDSIEVRRVLERSSKDLFTDNKQKLPFVNDLFNASYEVGTEYFLYINSDILVSKKLIDHLLETRPEATAYSRMDTRIPDFSANIRNGFPMQVLRIEPAGFDGFFFDSAWFSKEKHRFHDMFLGRPAFDNCYGVVMAIHSKNIWNNRDEYLYHPTHPNVSYVEDEMYRFNYEKANGAYKSYMDFWREMEDFTYRKRKDFGTFRQTDAMEILSLIREKEKFISRNK